jgi:hypothetical protein
LKSLGEWRKRPATSAALGVFTYGMHTKKVHSAGVGVFTKPCRAGQYGTEALSFWQSRMPSVGENTERGGNRGAERVVQVVRYLFSKGTITDFPH